MMTGVQAEIRTDHFHNTNLERYLYCNQLGILACVRLVEAQVGTHIYHAISQGAEYQLCSR
jgi:hypothetical protein